MNFLILSSASSEFWNVNVNLNYCWLYISVPFYSFLLITTLPIDFAGFAYLTYLSCVV